MMLIMALYRRLSRNYCETCKKNLIVDQSGKPVLHFSTWVNSTNPEDLVSFCSYACFEYFIANTHKDEKVIDDLLHGIPNIEDNKNDS